MRRAQWLRVKELATAAEVISRDQWKNWLLKECADDEVVRQEVYALLTADETATSFGTVSGAKQTEALTGVVPGRALGSWRLVCELGSGGMGAVWLAEHTDSEFHMLAAIKLVKALDSNELLARFRRERQILADLKHPNICMLHDGGTTEEGLPYLVMEYVDGQTIDRWCENRQLSSEEMLGLFRNACLAVAYAHRKGVLHRDIKPQNIMVTQDGLVKLMDFGIAGEKGDDDAQMTLGFSPMTPEYAAPERIQGSHSSAAADIYALGLVLFRLLTGMRPRLAEGKPVETLRQFATDTEHAELLLKVADFLDSVLDPDPEKRPETVDLMVQDVDHILYEMTEDTTGGFEHKALYDAVLWYHPDARTTVENLARRLEDETGLKLWLDVWHLVPGEDRAESLVYACKQTHCLVAAMTSENQGPWEDLDQRHELVNLWHKEKRRVVPLLLNGAQRPSQESKLPPFMRRRTWATISESIFHQELETLANAIRGLPPGRLEEIDTETCPFRGLEAFREEDRRFFFGREAIIQRLMTHMSQNKFLAVLGPSGSGKSSVVQAGLIPLLRERNYHPILFTPASKPLEEMAFALRGMLNENDRATHAVKDLFMRLQQDNSSLHTIGKSVLSTNQTPLCLVVDQFEEIFTLAHDQKEVGRFLDNLFYAVEQPDDAVRLVITMRSDFLGNCALWTDLNSHVIDHMIQVEPMSQEDLTLAVRAPAEAAGLRFEPGLVESIMDDVHGSSGELPLLEHALLELYERRSGIVLTAVAYARIGGIEGALARRAELIYQSLDTTGRLILRKMFTLCLVHPGEGAEDTRRRTTRDELLNVSDDFARSEVLLQSLIEARLLTAQRNERRGVDQVDVAHEALIRKWDRIRTWMAEDRETARAIARLRHRASVWDEAGRDEDHLLRGGPLYQMRELVDLEEVHLSQVELDYVNAGVELAEREEREKEAYARRLRLRRNQASLLGSVALLLAIVAFWLSFKAGASQAVAEEQRKLAQAQTRESNYNLAQIFNERAGSFLDKGQADIAALYALAGLAHEIAEDKTLEGTTGRLFSPEMALASSLLWTSPVAPMVTSSAFSSDGQQLALGGWDGDIKVLQRDGRILTFPANKEIEINSVAFSPDSRYLASASEDLSIIYLWTLATGEYRILNGHDATVKDLVFLANDQLASTSLDGSVGIWRLSEGDLMEKWQVSDTELEGMALSPDRQNLAVFDLDGVISFWRQRQDQAPLPITNENALVTAITYGGDFFFAAYDDGSINIWDADDLNLIKTLNSGQEVVAMTFDPFRKQLIVADDQDEIHMWDPESGAHVVLQETRSNEVAYPPLLNELYLSADGQFLAGATDDFTFRLWDFKEPDGDHMTTPGAFEPAPLSRLGAPMTLSGHAAQVRDVAFSPEGKLVASADSKIIRLWEMPAGTPAGTLVGHTDVVNVLTFSADGSKLASASSDTDIILWYRSKDRPSEPWTYRRLSSHTLPVQSLAFSNDGRLLISAALDNQVKFWDVADGSLRNSVDGYQPNSIAISPDNQMVAVNSGQGTFLWRIPQKREATYVPGDLIVDTLAEHQGIVNTATFSADGRYVATGSVDGTIKIWPVDASGKGKQPNAQSLHTLTAHTEEVTDVRFLKDQDSLVSASQDGTIRLWALPEHLESREGVLHHVILSGHTDRVNSLDFNKEETLFVSGSYDRTVRLWQLPDKRIYSPLTAHQLPVNEIAFSNDKRVMVSAGEDNTVCLWRVADGKLLETLYGHSESVQSVAFSRDNRLIASASSDGTIIIWTRAWGVGEPTRQLAVLDAQSKVYSIVFTPDTDLLISGSFDEKVKVFKVPEEVSEQPASIQPALTLSGHEGFIKSVAVTQAGDLLASGSSDKTIRLWRLPDGEPLEPLVGHTGDVWMVAFSPDGKLLASCADDHSIRLWDVSTGAYRNTLRGHSGLVQAVKFSPDGKILASGSSDQTVRLWDAATGRPLATMPAHEDEVTSVAFHGGGALLASCSEDRTIRVWNLAGVNFFLGRHDAVAFKELNQKALQFFGYRMDGFRLVGETWVSLEKAGSRPLAKIHPFHNGRETRPSDTSLIPWLSRDIKKAALSESSHP